MTALKELKEAEKTLKENLDDPEANLAVGKYLCLFKGDWKLGLPHLTKGSDPKWKTAARMETPTPPADSEGQARLADHWLELAKSASLSQRAQVFLHAWSRYEGACEAGAAGPLKTKIEKRVSDIVAAIDVSNLPTPSAPPPRAVRPSSRKGLNCTKGFGRSICMCRMTALRRTPLA